MSDNVLNQFREVWFIDFEYGQTPDNLPDVRCLVAKEWRSGKVLRLWADQLSRLSAPPFGIGPDTLFIAFFASAEMSCFLALGWQLPCYVLDLFIEFRNKTNGRYPIEGNGLIGAMIYHQLDAIGVAEKKEMRDLALRGGHYTDVEKVALLDYCATDVIALEKLLPKMLPQIDLPRALYRGRYMKAVARMEANGIPIDVIALELLKTNWESIKDILVQEVDQDFGVYDGTHFVVKNFEAYLNRNQIRWPRLESGRLALDIKTFQSMSNVYSAIAPLYELKQSMGTMRLFDLPVGFDGRSRCMLSPFSSKTGRNQPSNSKYPFGPSRWVRGLMCPQEGYSLAYLDWKQQEYGIAAALSGDSAMIDSYLSGDPYLHFAKLAKAVPANATKESHSGIRDLYKQCVLGLQFGMGEYGLAERLCISRIEARGLLFQHHRAFPKFWEWSEAVVNCGLLGKPLRTVFGWTLHPVANPNPRSLANFPVQGNGAEMMRLAAIYATERGIRVCAPVHDAFLIEAPADEIEAVVAEMRRLMREASRVVLGGVLELDSDVEYFHSPDRYRDGRGVGMWNKVMGLIDGPMFPVE